MYSLLGMSCFCFQLMICSPYSRELNWSCWAEVFSSRAQDALSFLYVLLSRGATSSALLLRSLRELLNVAVILVDSHVHMPTLVHKHK